MESQFPPEILSRIEQTAVVSVLVINNPDHAVPLAKALLAGGVDVMELTLRTDSAVESLRRIRADVPEMLAGIGTVLNRPGGRSDGSGGTFCGVSGTKSRCG